MMAILSTMMLRPRRLGRLGYWLAWVFATSIHVVCVTMARSTDSPTVLVMCLVASVIGLYVFLAACAARSKDIGCQPLVWVIMIIPGANLCTGIFLGFAGRDMAPKLLADLQRAE